MGAHFCRSASESWFFGVILMKWYFLLEVKIIFTQKFNFTFFGFKPCVDGRFKKYDYLQV
jgi:hypothetical protein